MTERGEGELSALRGGLVASLAPVRARSWGREALGVLGIGAVQLAGFFYLQTKGGVPDFLFEPMVLTKIALFALAAVSLTVCAVRAFDPAARGEGRAGVAIAMVVGGLSLALLDRTRPAPGLVESLQPGIGIGALVIAQTLALPVLLALLLAARGAAVTDRRRAGLLSGAAAGAWGILLYAVQCPMVSVWYVVPWYGGSVVLMALIAWAVVARAVRW